MLKVDGSLINDHQIEYFEDIIDYIGERNENIIIMCLNTREVGLYGYSE